MRPEIIFFLILEFANSEYTQIEVVTFAHKAIKEFLKQTPRINDVEGKKPSFEEAMKAVQKQMV